jgi:hypothetical protein
MNNQFKPILFSTPMVQAILDGRKTQTRRTVKQAIAYDSNWKVQQIKEEPTDGIPRYEIRCGTQYALPIFKCPYGKVGDVLWVREKFRRLVDCESGKFHSFSYYADMPEAFHKQFPHKWKPSIHMPKNACRLFLEITNVRVERLHDISEDDAVAEGVISRVNHPINVFSKSFVTYYDYISKAFPSFGKINAKSSFASLWQSINGDESWNANPWVWVVEFKKTTEPWNFNLPF